MADEKGYQISFKTYHNERIKPVTFHGKEMYPLYLQLTYNRQTIYFKSYYFDLFSKSKYVIRHFSGNRKPVIKEVIEKEETLINDILKKNHTNFSLALFKERYEFCCRDIIQELESGFFYYLFVYLTDEGVDFIGTLIYDRANQTNLNTLLRNMKKAFKPSIYDKLIENAAYYAPPYLPVFEFAENHFKERLITFPVFQWEDPAVQKSLAEFMAHKFPAYDYNTTLKQVKQIIEKKKT
ncbi:MAG: hypothetical protein ABUT20_52790 [Bacteroidota bacterium]